MKKMKIGLTRDLLTPDGQPSFGNGPLEILDNHPNIEWAYLPEHISEITPDIAADYDGLYVNSPLVSAASVARDDCRLKIVSRHGVGYDSVDVAALNARGIAVTNTPIAIRRPVAVAALTMIFALAGRLVQKDRLLRAGLWDERTAHMGLGLTTRKLGIIGAGGIGQELMRVAAPFGWQMLVADPVVKADTITPLGGQLKSLSDVMREADFIVVCCVLNKSTHHLINSEQLGLMKPQAFLINMARGPVVDEAALIKALQDGQIAGAGLDVFEQEPIATDNPLIAMDQVLLTPHALCWTDECFDQIAREGLGCIADFAAGQTPRSVIKI